MGDRNIANPFGSTQGQHYNDQDPTNKRGQRRGQRRIWINASRYGSHEGSYEGDKTFDIPWSQNKFPGGERSTRHPVSQKKAMSSKLDGGIVVERDAKRGWFPQAIRLTMEVVLGG